MKSKNCKTVEIPVTGAAAVPIEQCGPEIPLADFAVAVLHPQFAVEFLVKHYTGATVPAGLRRKATALRKRLQRLIDEDIRS